MKMMIVVLLFLSALLFVATAFMQAIMGHWILAVLAAVLTVVMASLSGIAARAT